VATMAKRRMKRPATHGLVALAKTTTGIKGLDEVTGGGVPRGRPSLVCGPAGSGKTLLAMEFLVRGITQFGEPGVFVAFEETREDLVARRPRSARTRSTGKRTLSSVMQSCSANGRR
jgi:circadian clock protein KaiC